MRHLSEVVDFEVLVGRDGELAAREGAAALRARDRALAAKLPKTDTHDRLRRWVQLRRAAETELPGDRAGGIVTLVGWILLIMGAVVGGTAAAALLMYDGRSPINVLAWLLYIAAIPFALGVLLVLGLLVPRRWLPRGGPAQAFLGSVLRPLVGRLPGGTRTLRSLLDRTGRYSAALDRWLLVGLTQVFTLGFLAAALSTLLVKITITDLTFSWSTTLNLSDAQVTELVQAIAKPWAAVFPEAVPDADAVARSNYRRFVDRFRDTAERTPVDLAVGAMWWKLCVAAVVVYGLVPRLLLLLLARWRWRSALARWPDLERPEVRNLVDRMEDSGAVFTPRHRSAVAPRPETEVPEASGPAPSGPALETAETPGLSPDALAVAWGLAATDLEGAAEAVGVAAEDVLSAGADLDLSAERAVLSAAAERERPVVVLMPDSEPPIEDVLAFLRELRAVSPAVEVAMIEREDGAWRLASADKAWTRALSKVRGVEARRR